MTISVNGFTCSVTVTFVTVVKPLSSTSSNVSIFDICSILPSLTLRGSSPFLETTVLLTSLFSQIPSGNALSVCSTNVLDCRPSAFGSVTPGGSSTMSSVTSLPINLLVCFLVSTPPTMICSVSGRICSVTVIFFVIVPPSGRFSLNVSTFVDFSISPSINS